MSFGCACVAIDCDYGPREIIKDGHNGLLVRQNDLNALADGMTDVLANETLKNNLQHNALLINQTNSAGHITNLWQQTIFGTHPQAFV
jgi:glycosyltransferase involved in cell wall biosynthesis